MSDESRDPTAEELANEQNLRRFELEADFHQSNILPLDQAMNEGRFYGLLIRGGQPLTPVQRIGLLMIAIIFCGPGLCVALASDPALKSVVGNGLLGGRAPVLYLSLTAIAFLVGMRIVWVALRPSRKPKIDR